MKYLCKFILFSLMISLSGTASSFEVSGIPLSTCPSPDIRNVVSNSWITSKISDSIANTQRYDREFGFSIYQCRKCSDEGYVYEYVIAQGTPIGRTTINLPGKAGRPKASDGLGECRTVGDHHVHPVFPASERDPTGLSIGDKRVSFHRKLPGNINRTTTYPVQIKNPNRINLPGLAVLTEFTDGPSYIATALEWNCPGSGSSSSPPSLSDLIESVEILPNGVEVTACLIEESTLEVDTEDGLTLHPTDCDSPTQTVDPDKRAFRVTDRTTTKHLFVLPTLPVGSGNTVRKADARVVTDADGILDSESASKAFSSAAPTLNCNPQTVTWGDPHLITLDRLKYDFQSMGEFVLAKSSVSDLEIQVRQKKFRNDNITVNSAVAANVDGTKVSIHLGPEVYVNGNLHAGDIVLDSGGGVAQTDSGYRLTWQDGSIVDVAVGRGAMSVSFALNDQHRENISGLIGNWDGDSSNDFRIRNGDLIERPIRADQLYKEYADSWRILQPDSLFFYESGLTTIDHTDLSIPRSVFTVDDLDPSQREFAEGVCLGIGLSENDDNFISCVIDVAFMGEEAAEPYRTGEIPATVAESIEPEGEIQPRTRQLTTGVDNFHLFGPEGSAIAVYNVGSLDPNWVQPSVGNWIAPDNNGSFNHPTGTYRYTTSFLLAETVNQISGAWASDDGITVSINGTVIISDNTVSVSTHNSLHQFTEQNNGLFLQGTNELTIEIFNAGGPTGVYFNASVSFDPSQNTDTTSKVR